MYYGDFNEDATVHLHIPTNAANGGRVDPSDGFELADFRIYKGSSATQKTSTNGLTITNAFDGMVGAHVLSIDTSNDTGDAGFWTGGSEYAVYLYPDTETIDGQNVIAVWQFSLANRYSINGAGVAAELATYDGPTRAEATADKDEILTRLGTPAGADVSADIASNLTAINQRATPAQVATELATYDGPTRAEATADKDEILTRLGTPAGADVVADIATRATPAQVAAELATYDGPTRAEATADKNEVLTRLGTPAGADIAADIATRATPAQVGTQVAAELATYDGPTRAEATTDKNEILTRIGVPAGADVVADIATRATPAQVASELNTYDGPTRAEATADKNEILTRLGTPAGADVSADIASNLTAINQRATPAQVATELATYDGPTRAEATADKDEILTRLGTPAGADVVADIATRATPAQVAAELVTYDGPTRAEATADKDEIMDLWDTTGLSALTQQAPPNSPTALEAIMYLYSSLSERIRVDSASGFMYVYNAAGTVIYKKQVSDDGTEYDELAAVSGP